MAPTADVFDSAPTEAVGRLVRLVDVSALLPRNPHRSYPKRTGPIRRIAVHQTQGGILPPPTGLIREAEYFVAPPGDKGIDQGRGWPGFAYTFWVPFRPAVDGEGRLIVYRCQPDDVVSNHTRTVNEDGVAVAFQGNFASVKKRDLGAPSTEQLQVFPELLTHLVKRYGVGFDAIHPHSAFTKPDCPGFELERQIHLLQGRSR